MEKIFTIGHSTHTIETFIRLLQDYNITCIIDVRSMPYSRYNPQYNKEYLKTALGLQEIVYAHLGKEFGARHTKPSLLDEDGQVDFYRVRETQDFKDGILRLGDALEQGYKIALLCSEGDPLDCHRFSMISYQLAKEGYSVIHILSDGSSITQYELEQRMLIQYLPQPNFFDQVTPEQQLETAYRLVSKKVAYRSAALSAERSEEDT